VRVYPDVSTSQVLITNDIRPQAVRTIHDFPNPVRHEADVLEFGVHNA
jgi:hypothetical protein